MILFTPFIGDKMIIVTGGAGFIGSGVVRVLNERGYNNLIIVDNIAKTEKWKNLVGKKFDDILYKGDLFDWLQAKKGQIEAILHLGACSSTLETDGNYLLENNYRYSRKLASWALKNDVRFIYASSAATYGDGSLGFDDDHERMEKYRPLNMYGYSKHLFDLWLKRENLLDKVTGLKYFNVFGPNEFHKGRMASAVLKMVPDVMTKGHITLFKSDEPQRFADGEQVRDFIYVKDVAQMTVSFLEERRFGIYNVGSGVDSTWNQLAKAVIKALDRKGEITYIDMPNDLKGKYQNYTKATMEKWKNSKLPSPCYSLEEGVIDYVQNYIMPSKVW